MKIKKILFPTDFSKGALHALPFAVEMAKNYHAKLLLLHVIYDVASGSGLYVPHISFDNLYADLEAGAKKQLESFGVAERKKLKLKSVEYTILRGVPYEEILKFIKEKNIDLVVMGTHGRKGLDRVLFGSTAERVVRNSSCPVLSVRGPKV